MVCPKCHLEMMRKREDENGPVWACVNPQCPNHDKEMTRKPKEPE